MPELPEVETTVRGLRENIMGQNIKDVWTDLSSVDKRQHENVASPKYFKTFLSEVRGKKIISVERRAKNILINLSGDRTILVHLKMTGHLLYGKYKFAEKSNQWAPNYLRANHPLFDSYNKYVHIVFVLSGGQQLAFSDARKFGKITLLDTKTMNESKHLKDLGPEPLDKNFDLAKLKERLSKKPNGKIKTVLMDQSVIAGIGNIYSDEILWRAGVHPERKASEINESELKLIYKAIRETLAKGIDFGGDSMSDYRNIHGLSGKFQLHHEAYRRTGQKCRKAGCSGIIKRKTINGRSAHFCSMHQK